MGQIVVDVGSFDHTSHNGNTAYSTVRYFNIPANAGITGCVATFTTHVNTGNFQGKSFSFNGVQAHPNTPWPTSGISLNSSLLSAGQNTFRAAVKSQAGLSARWSIGSITLTITYDDGGGGGGGSTGGGGPVVISPSSIDAGAGSVTVTCPAESGVWHMINWTFGTKSGQWSHYWETGGTGTIDIPLSWMSEIPNTTQGTLAIRVRRSTTPAEPYSYASDQTTNITINVPASVAPSIDGFSASRIANNTPVGIADYVQNVSGVSLAMSGVSGAYGSTISGYKITGAGYTFNTSSGSISVLSISGNIAFTAEVTDSRGRKATKVVGIDVLSYSPVSASDINAYRSDASKNPADEGAFATLRAKMVIGSLNGQNTGEVKGRVYEKGTAPSAWTTMANDTLVLFGGSLSVEKSYTADILVADLITSYQYSIDIPTATVIMGIAPNGDGVSFGTYPEAGKVKSVWPIVAPGIPPNPNLLHNWDFTNPVNQRGASGTFSGGTYGIDRWKHFSGAYGIVYNGYLAINGAVGQWIEGKRLVGKTCTFSLKKLGGQIVSVTTAVPDNSEVITTVTTDETLVIGSNATDTYVIIITASELGYLAAKLELGTVSTLHLDPPMDYGAEVLKCQRFLVNLGTYAFWNGYAISSTVGVGYITVPVPMRINPTLSTTAFSLLINGSSFDATITSVTSAASRLDLVFSGAGIPINISGVGTAGAAKLLASSDL